MATPEDLRVGAEYIKLADAYEEVPGGKNNRNYANVDVIVDVAKRHKCDAVWAGWGHASEFPALPTALAANGLVFLGPGAKAMRDLGDKIASSILAQSAKVPCIPWSGDGVTVDYMAEGIPDEKFKKCCVTSLEEARAVVERIGLPVMIKASEGGGGKGIRKVESADQLADSFRRVQAEVPGSPIFLMRMGSDCRHLEVQILGDEYGNALALYGRDCSIQRRHQKIIEEGPVVVASAEQLREMEMAAVRLAKTVGYVGAGTIEYLFTGGKYYFLELNPRLQVEHPVTELISDVNLPATQLCIGMGLRLEMVPHLRAMYSREPFGSDPINFETELPRPPKGHVIACRITAENALKGFQPTSGNIQELNFRSIPNVWGYFSVASGGGVHEFADSQIGHLFAWGPDRDYCRNTLILGLKELSIRGDISTPVDYLIRLMETPEFRNNTTSTQWLDGLIAKGNDQMMASSQDDITVVVCGAVCQAFQKTSARKLEFLRQLSAGRVPSKQLMELFDRIVIVYNGVEYVCDVRAAGPETFCMELVPPVMPDRERLKSSVNLSAGGEMTSPEMRAARAPVESHHVLVEVRPFVDGGLLIIFDGKSRNCYLNATPPVGWKLVIDKASHVLEQQRDPSKIFTPSNGKIIKYLVPNNSHVKAGTPFVECEIMKMILPLVCEVDGVVTFQHGEGTVLSTGELVARVTLDDLSAVHRAKPYKKHLPRMARPRAAETKPHLRLQELQKEVDNVLKGFFCPDVAALATQYLDALTHPLLASSMFGQLLSEHKSSLPSSVKGETEEAALSEGGLLTSTLDALEALAAHYEEDLKSALGKQAVASPTGAKAGGPQLPRFPGKAMTGVVNEWASRMSPAEGASWLNAMAPMLVVFGELAEWDPHQPEVRVVQRLLEGYLDLEDTFDSRPHEVVLMNLRDANKGKLDEVYRIALSYFRESQKVDLLAQILEQLLRASRPISSYQDALRRCYVSRKPRHVRLSLVAGRLLAKAERVSPGKRLQLLRNELQAIPQSAGTPDFQIQAHVRDVMSRTAYPLDVVMCAYASLDTHARIAEAVIYEYVTWLIGSMPFLSAKPTLQATVPRLSFEWVTAPFDFGDQGLPPGEVAAARDVSIGPAVSAQRHCVCSVFETSDQMAGSLGSVLRDLKVANDGSTRNILVLVVLDAADLTMPTSARGTPSGRSSPTLGSEDRQHTSPAELRASKLHAIVASHVALLRERCIMRVTFVLGRFPQTPFLHSFRLRLGYREDALFRNLVPEMAFLLELRRLDRYELERCSVESARVHVYSGVERVPAQSQRSDASRDRRLFVRCFVNTAGLQALEAATEIDWSSSALKDHFAKNGPRVESALRKMPPGEGIKLLRLLREVETVFIDALNSLESIISGSRSAGPTSSNSLFLAIMTSLQLPDNLVAHCVHLFMSAFSERVHALNVHLLELTVSVPRSQENVYAVNRFVVSNNSGFLWRLSSSSETRSLSLGVPSPKLQPHRPSNAHSMEEAVPTSASLYTPMPRVARRRVHCRALGTTYVYDLLDVLERALIGAWSVHQRHGGARFEGTLLEAVELRLDSRDVMRQASGKSVAGSNDVGMVAWRVRMCTPEYPHGRPLILIANDVSFEGGSFGPREDALYKQASELARLEGIPRIYVSANAGARIGLADEVLGHFQVAWKDPNDPTRGFDYLYVSPAQAQKLSASIKTRPVPGHADRCEITDIIGANHGIGVENLQGSGLIAGETALAYKEVFTLTVVTGRSVGIGAYVTRLGQRVIQNQGPILLTGYDALNRLLGREVYISHTQMGGPHIMYRNGVSHVDVSNDLDAMRATLRWLSFVPERVNQPLPIVKPTSLSDPINRPVQWHPKASVAYDPRCLLAGEVLPDGSWVSGFFDRGSFFETLGGWARTVVTGRARLGGVPVGVIAVETRQVQKVVPADPASDDSREEITQQAGQVWYPDSAYKTAQAIWDFNAGEQLPLFIFANWRGFSGGVSDMFNEVLKFGSMIVDALAVYKQPVFVYLPPFAELRGGSWAVIDPFVNPFGMMEMYTSESAQGGILEATGTVAIKFREREQVAAMTRLDPLLADLKAQRARLVAQVDNSADAPGSVNARLLLPELDSQIEERKEALSKLYHLIALRFCELHDTPGRMVEKKVVSKIVSWEQSRAFFAVRLQRRLLEARLVDQQRTAQPKLSVEAATRALYTEYHGALDDDTAVAGYLQQHLSRLELMARSAALTVNAHTLAAAVNEGTAVAQSALDTLLRELGQEGRALLRSKMSALQ